MAVTFDTLELVETSKWQSMIQAVGRRYRALVQVTIFVAETCWFRVAQICLCRTCNQYVMLAIRSGFCTFSEARISGQTYLNQ